VQFGKHEDRTAEHSNSLPFQTVLALHHHSVEKMLCSGLLSKKYKDCDTQFIILTLLSYGSETWSLRLREEHRLRVYEIGYWGEYFGLRGTR